MRSRPSLLLLLMTFCVSMVIGMAGGCAQQQVSANQKTIKAQKKDK